MLLTVLLLVCLISGGVLYRHFAKRVPILMYHRIAVIPGDRNALAPDKFKQQLAYLASHGYHTVSLHDLYEYYTAGKALPPKPVVLTFDDGYEDNFSVAAPLLTAHNMKATVFPIAGWVGRPNQWENFGKAPTTTMNWEQLRAWLDSGMEIGSHTVSHPFLSRLSAEDVQAELTESKKALLERLNIDTAFLCYPYGSYSAQVVSAAREAGYKGALAIYDQAPLWKLDLYALPRIPVSSRQPLWEFAIKVSWLHFVLLVLRKAEKNAKRLFKKGPKKA